MKIKNFRKVLLTIFLTGLFCAMSAVAAGPSVGGGGSEKDNMPLDRYAQDHMFDIRADEAYELEVNSVLKILNGKLPDFANRLKQQVKEKIFVGVDDDVLPSTKDSDVKHEIANRLVAFQRGPMVWVLKRNFLDRVDEVSRGIFYRHELLVALKLSKGEMSLKDMDEVIALNILLGDLKKNARKYSATALQDRVYAYGFDAGMTKDEAGEFVKTKNELMNTLNHGCALYRAGDYSEVKQIEEVRDFILNRRKNTQGLYSRAVQEAYEQHFSRLKFFNTEQLCQFLGQIE